MTAFRSCVPCINEEGQHVETHLFNEVRNRVTQLNLTKSIHTPKFLGNCQCLIAYQVFQNHKTIDPIWESTHIKLTGFFVSHKLLNYKVAFISIPVEALSDYKITDIKSQIKPIYNKVGSKE